MMYYTYVLLSLKSGRYYIGTTNNLKLRVLSHNSGNGSVYTSRHRPYKLVFYEAFLAKKDATVQEQFYKTGYGREVLKGKIKYSIAGLVHW